MKEKRKREKGITLIALVITIIVLLILAGITLSIVLHTGIIDNTLKATDLYKIQSYKEKIDLIKTSEYIKKNTSDVEGSLKELIVEELKNENWVSAVRTNEEESSIEENQIQIITTDGYIMIIEISENGNMNYLVEDKYDGEPYPTIKIERLEYKGEENEKIRIKVTASVQEGKKTKKVEKIQLVNTGEEKTYEEAGVIFEVENKGTYEFKATTDQGKSSSKKITINVGTTDKIEMTISTTEPRNTKTKGTQNGVETGPIIVKIDYGEVNVKREYKIGDEEWKQANKQIVEIEIDKNTSVVARHLDGEIAINTRTVEIKNVDNEAPKIENANAIVDKTKVTVNADIKDEASENAEQDIAGVTTTYNIDGGNYQKENIFIVEMAGEKTINIKAIDRAGNETIKEINVTTKFTTNNINGDSNKTYTGEETSPSNPVIPVGFKISNDGASWNLLSDGKTVEGWNSGLVIEDKDGNQFVWVPVDGTNVTYTKKDWAYKDVLITGLDVVKTDDFPEKVKTTWKQDEQSQITKYHGFYIARYEAGIPKDMEEEPIDKTSEGITKLRNTSGIPVSKKNQIPWGNITYTNAKTNAEMMYTGGNVQSGLLTGTMWDTTLQWLIKTNAVTESEVNNDSTKWGNHATSEIDGITSYSKNGIEWINENAKKPKSENGLNANCMWILKTGNTEYTKRNNIYDLAGNLWEWTYEIYDNDSNYHIHRSGGYQWYGSAPAGYRQRIAIDTATIQIGFRVALYINKDI